MPVSDLRSARVTGLAHQCLRAQETTKQAQPLTKEQVLWLEHWARNADNSYEKLLSSSFLLMLYARARHSDVRRATRILLDAGTDFIQGFVELVVVDAKQSRASRRKRLMLPVVAPMMGIADRPWASAWQANRKQWRLAHEGDITNDPLLPEMAADGTLLPCNMGAARASSWLRALLARNEQVNADSLLAISTHSLKATLLSWAAKCGMDTLERTILRYHSTGVNTSTLSYSRDAMAGPLRSRQNLIRSVRMQKFNPDDTRSGRLALSGSSSGSSGANSPTSSSSDAEEHEQVIQGASHVFAMLVSSGEYHLVKNPSSGITHIVKQGRDKLLCGRSIFKALVVCSEVNFSQVQICLACQSVCEGLLEGKWANKSWTVVSGESGSESHRWTQACAQFPPRQVLTPLRTAGTPGPNRTQLQS